MVPGSLGLTSAVLAAIATFAPSRATRLAISRPMPREAPVMNSVLPLSVDISVSPVVARPQLSTYLDTCIKYTDLKINHVISDTDFLPAIGGFALSVRNLAV